MKYIEQLPSIGSYTRFEFTEHDPSDFCDGDQIWSNGKIIEIYFCCDQDLLENLTSRVENKLELTKDLIDAGF